MADFEAHDGQYFRSAGKLEDMNLVLVQSRLLPLITTARPVVFIDEPEAFLHPPQANALGKPWIPRLYMSFKMPLEKL